MGKTTKTTAENAAVVENTTAAPSVEVAEKVVTETTTVEEKVVDIPLTDSDEIEIISLIPHVTYKDNKTGDFYEWEERGHVEIMTFGVLKEMRRGHKSYFNELWLKPLDERVIKYFNLTKVYENYESLMDETTYVRANINNICDTIKTLPNGLKWAICDKIKDSVTSGGIIDINVITTLEKQLNMDLVYLL